MSSKYLPVFRHLKGFYSPDLWAVLVWFAIAIVLHYPQQILGKQIVMWDSLSLLSSLGVTGHTAERILLLFPVIYAGYAFGTMAGFISLGVATAIMIPRLFLFSTYLPDALVETVGIILVGALANLSIYGFRRANKQRQEMLSKLELAYHLLQSHTRTIEEDENRLATLNQISDIVSQSLELSQILNRAIEGVISSMRVDAAWIFILNRDSTELLLATHRGFPEGLPRIKVGSGLSGQVAKTGEVLILEDTAKDPALPDHIKQQMRSAIIVPLRSKGKVNGTLGVSSLSYRSFQQGEIELLTAMGGQIGVAVDNARLYERQQEVLEELQFSEQRYRELFEGAYDAIWVHNMDGNLVAVNKASEELTGYSSKELLKMNVKSFLSEESIVVATRIRQTLDEGQVVEQPYEQRLIRRDGSQAILKLTSSLLKEDGRPTGFLHIARDVTLEKEMQDKLSAAYRELTESHQRLKESQEQLIQAEKLTSLGQLAASVAHEVNNPLSGVLIYTQLLIKKIDHNDIRRETTLEYLRKMETELIYSTKLIQNLFDFARQTPPAFRQVNLNEVVDRSYSFTAQSVALQHIQVIRDLDSSLPSLMADFDQLQQVCTNLIMNALQAMPGGGTLTLRTWAESDQGMIQVRDTGCGISPENMRKLFTPFFTTKREVKGVGLGLAVAYGIVQRHKGKIDVQSKVGEGTAFTLCLPLRLNEHEHLETAGSENGASASRPPE